AAECVLTPLCNRPCRHANDSGTAKRLLRHLVVPQEKKHPQDLIPHGMHPIELASGSGAPSVSAFQKPVLWAWLDLNQRPRPYQQSSAYRYVTRRFRRWSATVNG